MIREWTARALLLVYPAHTRASVGAEMVGTVLDSSDASRRAFARECVALVISGTRARARLRESEPSVGQMVDGYVLAGQIWLAVLLSHATAQILRRPADGVSGGLVFVLALWPILGMSAVGARRTAGTAATAWFVCLILIVGPARQNLVVIWLIPLASCLVMATCQQNRRRDLRRLLWLTPVVIMSVLPPSRELAFNTVQVDALIVGSAVAVAIVPINPRLLVACAVLWTCLGLLAVGAYHSPRPVPLLVISAPLVLLAAAARVVLTRRRRVGP